jgi:hypothetical protein
MKIEHDEIVRVFTEWDRRYRNNPEEFNNSVQHLLQNTPDTYGAGAAVYFEAVLEDMRRK